jgi:hypothetical protein
MHGIKRVLLVMVSTVALAVVGLVIYFLFARPSLISLISLHHGCAGILDPRAWPFQSRPRFELGHSQIQLRALVRVGTLRDAGGKNAKT